MVIVFPFLGAGFANISPTFLISCEVQTRYSKTLKYSEQYIRDHLSGTKVRIWICSEYDAVFNFFLHCLVQPKQVFDFLFHIKNQALNFQAVNLYFVCFEISLFKVFINTCKLTDEMSIDLSFFFVV